MKKTLKASSSHWNRCFADARQQAFHVFQLASGETCVWQDGLRTRENLASLINNNALAAEPVISHGVNRQDALMRHLGTPATASVATGKKLRIERAGPIKRGLT